MSPYNILSDIKSGRIQVKSMDSATILFFKCQRWDYMFMIHQVLKTVQQPPCLTFGFLIMNVLAKLLFQVTKYRIVIWKQAALMPELSCTAKMII